MYSYPMGEFVFLYFLEDRFSYWIPNRARCLYLNEVPLQLTYNQEFECIANRISLNSILTC